jgi:hypothetical protein
MRKVKVRCLRQLIARNHAALIGCCGDDLQQICDECNNRHNLMYSVLRKLAGILTGRPATKFVWIGTTLYKCGSLCMEMRTADSPEVLKVWITGETMKQAKKHVLEVGKSAKNLKRSK